MVILEVVIVVVVSVVVACVYYCGCCCAGHWRRLFFFPNTFWGGGERIRKKTDVSTTPMAACDVRRRHGKTDRPTEPKRVISRARNRRVAVRLSVRLSVCHSIPCGDERMSTGPWSRDGRTAPVVDNTPYEYIYMHIYIFFSVVRHGRSSRWQLFLLGVAPHRTAPHSGGGATAIL